MAHAFTNKFKFLKVHQMSGVVQVWGACLECMRPWIQPSALPKRDRKKKSLLVEDVETVLWKKKDFKVFFFNFSC